VPVAEAVLAAPDEAAPAADPVADAPEDATPDPAGPAATVWLVGK